MFRKRKLSVVFSIIYIVYCFHNIFFYYFHFFPVITTIRNPIYCNEVYFSNELGGYLWKPQDENVELFKNVIFYFNNMDGNSSSRFNVVRKIQKEFDTFTMIQMDYPGFGLSYQIPLSIQSIKKELTTVLNEVLVSNNVQKFICFGEGLGNWVMAMILDQITFISPDTIIHYNVSYSLNHSLYDRYSFLSFPFYSFHTKTLQSYYKNRFTKGESPRMIFIHNKNYYKEKNSFQCYYDLDFIPHEKKKIIEIDGSILSNTFSFEEIKNIMI